MPVELTFTWDSRDLALFRGGQIEKALSRSLRLAGNQAIRGLQRDATGFALSRKNLGKQVIVEDQSLRFPRRGAALSAFAWSLWIRGKPVRAAKFPHIDTRFRRSRDGVLVRFGGSGTQRLKSAFVAGMASGHKGIFRRRGKARLPIDEVFSSRLPARFGEGVMLTYADKTYRKLESAFARGLDRELSKLRGAR